MPRFIDCTKGNTTEGDEVIFPKPRYGTNEMTRGDVEALVAATTPLFHDFAPQFTTYSMPDPDNRSRRMDEAHQWLSEHTTGPWYWHESWGNHGHHIDTFVFVERTPDQKAFHKAFAHVFSFNENSPYELEKLAVLRGVLPRVTSQQSFFVWEHENSGYTLHDVDDKAAPRMVRFTFSIPAFEENFKAVWGDVFTSKELPSGEMAYTGPWLTGSCFGTDRDMGRWLSDNRAVGNLRHRTGGCEFEARYPETIAAVKRKWGHIWTLENNSSKFTALDYPSVPTRDIPAAFIAYLKGERDDFEAPYVADLKLPKKPDLRQTAFVTFPEASEELNLERNAGAMSPLEQELYAAILNGQHPRIKDILGRGAPVDTVLSATGDTGLNLSAEKGLKHTSIQLLDGGADPYIPNQAGVIPVVKALGHGQSAVAKEILSRSLPIPDLWRAAIREAAESRMTTNLGPEARRNIKFILVLAR